MRRGVALSEIKTSDPKLQFDIFKNAEVRDGYEHSRQF